LGAYLLIIEEAMISTGMEDFDKGGQGPKIFQATLDKILPLEIALYTIEQKFEELDATLEQMPASLPERATFEGQYQDIKETCAELQRKAKVYVGNLHDLEESGDAQSQKIGRIISDKVDEFVEPVEELKQRVAVFEKALQQSSATGPLVEVLENLQYLETTTERLETQLGTFEIRLDRIHESDPQLDKLRDFASKLAEQLAFFQNRNADLRGLLLKVSNLPVAEQFHVKDTFLKRTNTFKDDIDFVASGFQTFEKTLNVHEESAFVRVSAEGLPARYGKETVVQNVKYMLFGCDNVVADTRMLFDVDKPVLMYALDAANAELFKAGKEFKFDHKYIARPEDASKFTFEEEHSEYYFVAVSLEEPYSTLPEIRSEISFVNPVKRNPQVLPSTEGLPARDGKEVALKDIKYTFITCNALPETNLVFDLKEPVLMYGLTPENAEAFMAGKPFSYEHKYIADSTMCTFKFNKGFRNYHFVALDLKHPYVHSPEFGPETHHVHPFKYVVYDASPGLEIRVKNRLKGSYMMQVISPDNVNLLENGAPYRASWIGNTQQRFTFSTYGRFLVAIFEDPDLPALPSDIQFAHRTISFGQRAQDFGSTASPGPQWNMGTGSTGARSGGYHGSGKGAGGTG
jgi:hypothetical protein